MAEEQNKVTNCSVCFETFDADNVARLLPCGGTLCEKCIEELMDGESIDCPECGMEHAVENGTRSFPGNSFSPNNQKSNSHSNAKPVEPRCKEHGKHPSIYCKEPYCKKTILYLQTHHLNADIVDVDTEDKEIEALFTNLETAAENLRFYKGRILTVKEDIDKKNASCLDKLKARKDEILKKSPMKEEVLIILRQRFGELQKDVFKHIAEVNTDIDGEVASINEHLKTLGIIRELINKTRSTYEDIMGRLETVKTIEAQVKNSVSDKNYKYCEYMGNEALLEHVKKVKERLALKASRPALSIAEDVVCLCGYIGQKKVPINVGEDSVSVVSVKQEAREKNSTKSAVDIGHISDDASSQSTVPGPSSGGTGQKRHVQPVTPQEYFEGTISY